MGNVAAKRKAVLGRKPGQTPGLVVRRGTAFPAKYYVGLYGFASAGKTSLINSLLYAVKGRLRKEEWYEVAPPEVHGTHTMCRIETELSDVIVVVDNRGLTPESWRNQLTKNEIRNQIGKLD